MNLYIFCGTKILVFALIAYSVAIITEQKIHRISNRVLFFITLGIMLDVTDVTATTFMIIGSENTPFTLHRIIGYLSLAAMLIDTVMIWRHRLKSGVVVALSESLHLYSPNEISSPNSLISSFWCGKNAFSFSPTK
jgi:hypothetical protein